MYDNLFLMKETIECIPSADMRKYLTDHPMTLSILQKATIISYFADAKTIIRLFRQLARATTSHDEKALLMAAVSDYRRFEGIDDATQIIYEKRFPHTGAPFFPFLEVCNMPLLFSEHDLIKYKGKVYEISYLPTINKNCDFSDECYTCYSPDGSEHQHIHVCEAESVSAAEVKMAV